jgi:5-methylcytosine-specific restriction endonuclease McrA
VPTQKRMAFTRFNVFLRNRFRCQYCGDHFPSSQLAFEIASMMDAGVPSNQSLSCVLL